MEKKEMKDKMIMWAVGMVLERLTSEQVSAWLVSGIVMLRKAVIESPNKYDDLVVLPMLDVVEDIISKKE